MTLSQPPRGGALGGDLDRATGGKAAYRISMKDGRGAVAVWCRPTSLLARHHLSGSAHSPPLLPETWTGSLISHVSQ